MRGVQMNSKVSFEQRIKGAVYGFAIGDAMGATTEFMSKLDILHQYGRKGVNSIVGGGWLGLEKGQVTDDTQMMLCVAKAIESCNGTGGMQSEKSTMFLDQCAKNFVAWLGTNPPDVGNQCLRVISYFSNISPSYGWSLEWALVPFNNDEAQGNGGLMRALPLALLGDTRSAVSQGSLTHNSEASYAMISRYCEMIRAAFMGSRKDQVIAPYARSKRFLDCVVPTGHVVNTLNNAVYNFANTKSVEECIVRCVNDGGDADTIAAIAGGLAGAFYGYDNIPAKHVQALNKGVRGELDRVVETLVKFTRLRW